MQFVTPIPRRRLMQISAAGLALVLLPRGARAHSGPHRIDAGIEGFAFVPNRLTVKAGDSVVWTNHDVAPHTATAADGSWDTGRLRKGESAEIEFATPGTYAFVCAFHPNMKGEITVEPA